MSHRFEKMCIAVTAYMTWLDTYLWCHGWSVPMATHVVCRSHMSSAVTAYMTSWDAWLWRHGLSVPMATRGMCCNCVTVLKGGSWPLLQLDCDWCVAGVQVHRVAPWLCGPRRWRPADQAVDGIPQGSGPVWWSGEGPPWCPHRHVATLWWGSQSANQCVFVTMCLLW